MLIAYDFGDTIHILDIDDQGAALPDSANVLPLDGDRDATLDNAGYRTAGQWTQQGEAEGVTVQRLP